MFNADKDQYTFTIHLYNFPLTIFHFLNNLTATQLLVMFSLASMAAWLWCV